MNSKMSPMVPLFYVPPKRNHQHSLSSYRIQMITRNIWIMEMLKQKVDIRKMHAKYAPFSNMSQPAIHPPAFGTGTSSCHLLWPVPYLLLVIPPPLLSLVFSSTCLLSTRYSFHLFFILLLMSFPHLYIFKYETECSAEAYVFIKLASSVDTNSFLFFLLGKYIIATKWLWNPTTERQIQATLNNTVHAAHATN